MLENENENNNNKNSNLNPYIRNENNGQIDYNLLFSLMNNAKENINNKHDLAHDERIRNPNQNHIDSYNNVDGIFPRIQQYSELNSNQNTGFINNNKNSVISLKGRDVYR